MAKERYRNISGSVIAGAEPGDEFEFPEGDYNIAALLAGGHIESLSAKSGLSEKAKALQIEGRSRMTKDELAAAIAEAEGK